MKKTLTIVFLFLIITSCNSRKHYDRKIIKELTRSDFSIPTHYNYLDLFVTVQGNQIGVTHIDQLHLMYRMFYKGKYFSFEGFVADALNQELVLIPEHLEQTGGIVTEIRDKIKYEYNTGGLDFLLRKYLKKSNNNQYIVRGELLKENEIYGLLYYLFLNRYKVSRDDYIPEDYVEKWQLD